VVRVLVTVIVLLIVGMTAVIDEEDKEINTVISNLTILWILLVEIPGVFMGTQMRDLLVCEEPPSLVFARRHIQSACKPLVIHILLPVK
jgi:hypothetical protein